MCTMTQNEIEQILTNWSLAFRALRKDITFYGSPERCKERYAVEDTDNNVYILEKLHESEAGHKEKVARIVNFFHDKGICCAPYTKTTSETYVVKHNDSSYLLSKFIQGTPIQRPEYTADAWRAKSIGSFLINLHNISTSEKNTLSEETIDTFSLKKQIPSFAHKISHFNPEITARLTPILNFIEKELLNTYDALPVGFSHGDVHIMNIIWEEKDIKAVIDWEFFGYKPEMYDLALCIGCIGIEHPNYLQDAMATTLIQTVKESGIYEDISWRNLYPLIVAIRLVWLEFWLKAKDVDMTNLELTYLEVLIKEQEYLKKVWGL